MKFTDFDFSRPVYMAIVNATPDSFSDGGAYFSEDYNPIKAVDAALTLEDQGADIIDLGGESTRPAAASVSLEEELRRLEPVLEKLDGRLEIPLSVDTYKYQVAQSALERGAAIINDVTGGTDPLMRAVWSAFQPGVIIMHHLPGLLGGAGTSKNAAQQASQSNYRDVVEEVYEELQRRRDAAIQDGLPKENIALDVGIGFGKTEKDNWALLENIHEFHSLNCPLVVGVSRKRFINFSDEKTVEIGKRLIDQGVQILRVHKLPPQN